jgi:hypothetical protein
MRWDNSIMKKLRPTLALVAAALAMTLGLASPAAGATQGAWPAPTLAASHISPAQGPCPEIVGCGPGPACLFVGGCTAPCTYNCVDPNNHNYVKDPKFFGGSADRNPPSGTHSSGKGSSGGKGSSTPPLDLSPDKTAGSSARLK